MATLIAISAFVTSASVPRSDVCGTTSRRPPTRGPRRVLA
jgi:hypothetical protein